MKRVNNDCPTCFLKKLFMIKKKLFDLPEAEPYGNGLALTPPMGWSSWNTFKNRINQDVIIETAKAMKESGLVEAGYNYLNIDDCWMSSLRGEDGEWQSDYVTFKDGIPFLVEKINSYGLKCGLYSSNGTLTCEDLPASIGRERQDAKRLAEWGVEYFKYDFCHNVPLPKRAPVVSAITIGKEGEGELITLSAEKASLFGTATLYKNEKMPLGYHISGLDAGKGAIIFNNICVPSSGEYILNITVKKIGKYKKYAIIQVNGKETFDCFFPETKHWNNFSQCQIKIRLSEGSNELKIYNPITSSALSAVVQYRNMGRFLKEATKNVAIATEKPEKRIAFSICEWGKNQPHKWGNTAGNLWRTTTDIRPRWSFIKRIYRKTVALYEHGGVGGWNDPDMLEVGNGKLTFDQSRTHFALWCMLAAPLILGNDVRKFVAAEDGSEEKRILDLVKNKALIAIDSDPLGKGAKLLKKGSYDVLARPLSNNRTAICLANMTGRTVSAKASISLFTDDEYIGLQKREKYNLVDQFSLEKVTVTKQINLKLLPFECKVYIVQ